MLNQDDVRALPRRSPEDGFTRSGDGRAAIEGPFDIEVGGAGRLPIRARISVRLDDAGEITVRDPRDPGG